MNYKRFVSTIKKAPMPPVPDRLWHRIEQTILEKEQGGFHWSIFNIMPTAALAGAVMVFAFMICLNYVHNAQVLSYVKMLGSTEYVYEQCKYPG